MKAPLSAADNRVYQTLRDRKVLLPTTPDMLGSYGTSLAITCFDPQCFDDIYGLHRKFTPGRLSMGSYGQPGGLLLVPPASEVRVALLGKDSTAGEDIVKGARYAFTLAGVSEFHLYGHATCRAASDAGLELLRNFALYIEAVDILREALPGSDIRPFFHVSRDQKQLTWSVDDVLWKQISSDGIAV